MRPTLQLIALTFGAFLVAQSAQADDCTQIMGNFESHEGVRVCKDGSVEIGGKIADVSTHTPLGGYNGFPQKAGRDIEGAAHAVGHGAEHAAHEVGKGAEHATHEVGKALAKAFGW
jgi:hypothetical protein